MAWYSQAASAPPMLPPRPSSTYPSAHYDDQMYNRQSDGPMYRSTSPAPADYNYNFQINTFPQPLASMASPRPLPMSPPPLPSSQSLPSHAWNANIATTQQERRQSITLAPTYSPYASQSYPQPAYPSYPPPNLAIDTVLRSPQQHTRPASITMSSTVSSASGSGSSNSLAPPSTAPYPSVEDLTHSASALEYKSDIDQLQWARDVVRLLDRHVNPTGMINLSPTDPATPSPVIRLPPALNEIANRAVPIIISYTSHHASHIAALASYLRGKLLSTGVCEDFLSRDHRLAFIDFETAARGGETRAWYNLGRDYEVMGDIGRAKDCFQRGQAKGDCESTYRLGMAYLLGQLGLDADPYAAVPLLRQAYHNSDIDCPQPAYVYGMLLAGELDIPSQIPSNLVLPSNTHETAALAAQHAQARDALERAAYLCLPQAQYKCGWMYEHAAYGCSYDPLVSVQWYSLASQGGEIEADMALSKWFLCGADGQFGKNEKLARTFAEKAARKGHQNGAFAMGYYYELGIGGRKDTDQARKWYDKAARLGNREAIERLRALSQPNPHFLSAQEHESHINDTLVRRRTQAAMRSEQRPDRQPRRRGRDENDRLRMMAEADRAAGAHQAEFGARSPNPDMLSPRIGPGSGHTSHATYPSRPPSAYQSFALNTLPSPNPNSGHVPPMPMPIQTRRPSGLSEAKRYSLSDNPRDRLPSPTGSEGVRQGQSPVKKGPQTFAEMGFQSKPVADEGCMIM